MYKINVAKRKEYISPYTKETVENLLKANNIKLDNEVGYDAVYVWLKQIFMVALLVMMHI